MPTLGLSRSSVTGNTAPTPVFLSPICDMFQWLNQTHHHTSSPKFNMTAKTAQLKKKIAHYLHEHLIPKGYASRDLFDELLVLASSTLSLTELLVTYPSKVCSA